MTEKLSNEFEIRFRDLEENLKEIRFRMAEASIRSGRNPEDVELLAATKTVPVEVINYGIRLGIPHIGENRVQELLDKFDAYEKTDIQFIGHLQSNKVKYLIDRVSMIQSVDSLKLAEEISRLSVKAGKIMDILVEVNIGCEENKSGVMPDGLMDLLYTIAPLPGIRVKGLMAIPPFDASKTQTMGFFSKMTQYFVDIKSKRIDNVTMEYLSMGMSGDYEDAILCGANLVRVGTSLFGPRDYSR